MNSTWVIAATVMVIIVLFFTSGLTLFKSLFTPVTEFIKDFAGTAEAIFSTIDAQINQCKTVGWGTFWKGCVLGIGVGALAGIWLIGAFQSLFPDAGRSLSSAGAKAWDWARRLGTSKKNLRRAMREAGEKISDEMEKKGITAENNKALYNAAIEAVVAHSAADLASAEAAKIQDPDQMHKTQQAIEALRAQAKETYDDVRSSASQEEQKDVDNAMKDAGFPDFVPR